jgi:hypothetical protein
LTESSGVKSYNQFCPIAKATEAFCERWTARISTLAHVTAARQEPVRARR